MFSYLAYLILVGLSQAWIAVRVPVPAPRDDQRVLEVPRQDARGPVAGPPVRIAYYDRGAGAAVIYLHGSPGSGEDARALAPHLAASFRLVAPDLPGFGASTRSIPDYGIRAHARYVLELMDALRIDRVHFVAHSMGSGVAYCVADLAPDRVASITSYGGIGVQEREGSGDYRFEHFKYALGYGLLVVAPEIVPHFGWLGSLASRHAFIRNFWDTDQRPLRAVLGRLRAPLLLLQGQDDPLVSVAAALEHHRLVPHSELVVLDASHFLVFSERGARVLAAEILPFLERHRTPDAPAAPRTVIAPARHANTLAEYLHAVDARRPWVRLAIIAAATFVSQHAALAGGMLATERRLDAFLVLGVCFLSLGASDLCLWRLGRSVGRRRLPLRVVRAVEGRIDRHPGAVLVVAHVVPGARLLLVPLAGALGTRSATFLAGLVASAAVVATLWVVLGTSLSLIG